MEKILLGLLKLYRYLLSPWVGQGCRFYPSCSHYAESAIQEWGWWKGGRMSLCRILKCHPWHAGGVDIVPLKNFKDC